MRFSIKTIALLFTALLMACSEMTEEIEWESKNLPNNLVVDGCIDNTLGKHPIKLSLTSDYFNSSSERLISDASVSIHTANEEYIYVENQNTPGIYEAAIPYEGIPGNSYKMDIILESSIDEKSGFSAESEIIEGFRIDSMNAFLYHGAGGFDTESEQDSMMVVAEIFGKEPANINNYYLAIIYRNDTLVNEFIQDNLHFNDKNIGINGAEGMYLFFEESYNPGDLFRLELISITKDFDYFLTGLSTISEPQDPFGFSGPPANAVGNISNGALGYFNCVFYQQAEAIIEYGE